MAKTGMKVKTEGVERVQEYLRYATGEHDRFCNKANESIKFFHAIDTWSQADRAAALKAGRPIISIPLVRPMVKLIAGLMAQNPVECEAKPVEGGDKKAAKIFSELMHYVDDQNYVELVDMAVTLSGVVTGRGVYCIDTAPSFDRFGRKIIVKDLDPRDVIFDPASKRYIYDDGQFVIVRRWMTKRDISAMFGKEKAERISTSEFLQDYPQDVALDPYSDELTRYCVYECYWKDLVPVRQLYDALDGGVYDIDADERVAVPAMGMERHSIYDIAAVVGTENIKVVNRRKPAIKITTICGDVELQNREGKFNKHPWLSENFNIIRYMPSFLLGENSTIVDDLKGLERESNLSHSYMLHAINVAGNSAWVMEQGALVDKRVLEDFGSMPGVVLELVAGKMYGQHLIRVDPGSIPQFDRILQTREIANQVANLNPAMMGFADNSSQSGRSLAIKVNQGTTALAIDTKPFFLTKRLVGRAVMGAIHVKMPDEQALRIIDPGILIKKEILQQEPPKDTLKQLMLEEIAEIWRDFDITQYDVVAQEIPKSSTRREANFEKLKDLVQSMGIPTSPTMQRVFVKAADIPYEQEILDELDRMEIMQQMPPPGTTWQKFQEQQQQMPQQAGAAGAMNPNSLAQSEGPVNPGELAMTKADMDLGPLERAVA